MEVEPRDAYWWQLRTELRWPFEPRDPARAFQHTTSLLTQRLDAIAERGTVPFHRFVRELHLATCVRDALAMLVIAATSQGVRARANPSCPSSPAVPVSLIVNAAADTPEKQGRVRDVLERAPAQLERLLSPLSFQHQPYVVATAELVELVTGRPWSEAFTGTLIETSLDAHVGAIDDFGMTKLVAIARSTARPRVVHVVGPKGGGRLRVAASLLAREGLSRMLVVEGRTLPPSLGELAQRIEAAVHEAAAHRAGIAVACIDELPPGAASTILARARAAGVDLVTTSAATVRWSASAIAVTLPEPDLERAWRHELERAGLGVEGDASALASVRVPRHAITMTTAVARRLYDQVSVEALAEIARHFSPGADHG